MDLFTIAIGFAGVAVGAWGYRYLLKRNPAMLERLAAEIKARGERLRKPQEGGPGPKPPQ